MQMNFNDAKVFIKNQLKNYLEMKGIDTNTNFCCLNPKHDDTTPSMVYLDDAGKGPLCYCHGCSDYYDTLDIVSIDYNLDKKQAYKKCYELFHIDIDNNQHSTLSTQQIPQQQKPKYSIKDFVDAHKLDLTTAINDAHQALLENQDALAHYLDRGLSLDIIKQYKLGFSKLGHNAVLAGYDDYKNGSKKDYCYQFILPYTNSDGGFSYFVSEINDRSLIDEHNHKYRKINSGKENALQIKAELFNERYLEKDTPKVIYICEGVYDALSIEMVGAKAIAFVGVGHQRFLSLCKKYQDNLQDTTFILSLDNDNTGKNAIEKLKQGLDFLNLKYLERLPAQKDFNEMLQNDAQSLYDFVADTQSEIDSDIVDYLKTSNEYHIQSFVDAIENSKNAVFYSTSLSDLDYYLNGGLQIGELYSLGAPTSLGKTSFALQIMDNIAKAGSDVLIFSLEMSRHELMARSVSRFTYKLDKDNAKSTIEIMNGKNWKNFSPKECANIQDAIKEYSEISKNIFIQESVGNINAFNIREAIQKHIDIRGKKPVVMIDYLQILAPINDRYSDKQNIDYTMLELKRITRDLGVTIFVISSFNRSNYNSSVNFTAFKESGAIEYTSSVVLALQYKGFTDDSKNNKEVIDNQEKAGREGKMQEIECRILKNRNGIKKTIDLGFIPAYNTYTSIYH